MKFLVFMTLGVVGVLGGKYQALKEFSSESNQFIGDLYKELVKEHSDNFLVCPLSVQSVFALLSVGATGNTAKQITTSLHLPKSEYKLRLTFYHLGRSLQGNQKLYTMSNANKIYVANNFNVSDQYKRTVGGIFSADIQSMDFEKPQQAVAEMNKWVEEKTHDKIKNLVNENMVNPDVVAVLINALYFEGKWVKQFEDTINMPFYHKENITYTNMMTITDKFNYSESPELKAKFLELPYEGNEMTMTFVLPDDVEGLSALENRIADVLVAPKFEKQKVNVFIPQFKIDTTIPLVPTLKALGITDAFSNAADFSKIGENQKPLIIGEVVQKAFIEVDQKGTTAAAAAAVVIGSRNGVDFDFNFVANHPFIFYLKHKLSGIIFIGRYSLPEDIGTDPSV